MFVYILFGFLFGNLNAQTQYYTHKTEITDSVVKHSSRFVHLTAPDDDHSAAIKAYAEGIAFANLNRELRETFGLKSDALENCLKDHLRQMPPVEHVIFTETESKDLFNGINVFKRYGRTPCYTKISAAEGRVPIMSQNDNIIVDQFSCNYSSHPNICHNKLEIPVDFLTAKSSEKIEISVETKLSVVFARSTRYYDYEADRRNFTFFFGPEVSKYNATEVIVIDTRTIPDQVVDVFVDGHGFDLLIKVPYEYTYGGNLLIKFQQPYQGDYFYFLPGETLLQCTKKINLHALVEIKKAAFFFKKDLYIGALGNMSWVEKAGQLRLAAARIFEF